MLVSLSQLDEGLAGSFIDGCLLLASEGNFYAASCLKALPTFGEIVDPLADFVSGSEDLLVSVSQLDEGVAASSIDVCLLPDVEGKFSGASRLEALSTFGGVVDSLADFVSCSEDSFKSPSQL